MKSWADVVTFIDKHQLPLKVERFNISLRGCLVSLSTGDAIAYTVKDAARAARLDFQLRGSLRLLDGGRL